MQRLFQLVGLHGSDNFFCRLAQPGRVLLEQVQEYWNKSALAKKFMNAPHQKMKLLFVQSHDLIHQLLDLIVFLLVGEQRFPLLHEPGV